MATSVNKTLLYYSIKSNTQKISLHRLYNNHSHAKVSLHDPHLTNIWKLYIYPLSELINVFLLLTANVKMFSGEQISDFKYEQNKNIWDWVAVGK